MSAVATLQKLDDYADGTVETRWGNTPEERIGFLRLAHQMTQETLGKHLDLTGAHVSRATRGECRFSAKVVARAAMFFGVPEPYLYHGRGLPKEVRSTMLIAERQGELKKYRGELLELHAGVAAIISQTGVPVRPNPDPALQRAMRQPDFRSLPQRLKDRILSTRPSQEMSYWDWQGWIAKLVAADRDLRRGGAEANRKATSSVRDLAPAPSSRPGHPHVRLRPRKG